MTPSHINQLDLEKFQLWLIARGSAILAPTNSWEVLRFDAEPPGIIYHNAKGRLSYVGSAQAAMEAFLTSGPWRAYPATPPLPSFFKKTLVKALLQRDGGICIYCGLALGDDVTVEHFVPLTHRGPHNIANTALVHKTCNEAVDHLDVRAKIEFAIKRRSNVKE